MTTKVWALGKDPRLAKITKAELESAFLKTNLPFSTQLNLLSRADWWGLEYDAYDLSRKQAQKKPNDPNSQLLYGLALRRYAEHLFFTKKGEDSVKFFGDSIPIIRDQFEMSLKMNPEDSYVHLAYGFWLWKFGGDMPGGLELVKKSLELNPKSVNAQASLGEMYSNTSGNCYNPKEAERLLNLAIKSDPQFAYPRWTLMSFLFQRGRFVEANKQLDAYIELIPTQPVLPKSVTDWRKQIQEAIEKKKAP